MKAARERERERERGEKERDKSAEMTYVHDISHARKKGK